MELKEHKSALAALATLGVTADTRPDDGLQ